MRVFEQVRGGNSDSWSQGGESLKSLLFGVGPALFPSSANSFLWTRPHFGPPETDYCGMHYQLPFPSAF